MKRILVVDGILHNQLHAAAAVEHCNLRSDRPQLEFNFASNCTDAVQRIAAGTIDQVFCATNVPATGIHRFKKTSAQFCGCDVCNPQIPTNIGAHEHARIYKHFAVSAKKPTAQSEHYTSTHQVISSVLPTVSSAMITARVSIDAALENDAALQKRIVVRQPFCIPVFTACTEQGIPCTLVANESITSLNKHKKPDEVTLAAVAHCLQMTERDISTLLVQTRSEYMRNIGSALVIVKTGFKSARQWRKIIQ